jgi:hypothetical protein
MPDAVAFVVMPFDKKPTGRSEAGVPVEIDFDAVWNRIYRPVLTDLGYEAVRADSDVGALIVAEMIQRLALADLVVADVTLPNANVYYEVGVRHAAQRVGCVLVSAKWAKPVFDLAQLRQLRFPLDDGTVGGDAAAAARDALVEGIGELVGGSSPVFDAVEGYPDLEGALSRASAFREQVAKLSAFDAEVRAARAAPKSKQQALALEIVARYGQQRVVREAVVLELIRLLRDVVGWEETLAYIKSLPENVARHALVVEQRALALGKTGDRAAAVGELEALIGLHGGTPERFGLLGGRYKELYREAAEDERRHYLDKAIEAYERSALLDLNGFYAVSNLPRLYRARNDPGDADLATDADRAALRASRRVLELGIPDEWARSTLLGCAFGRGDVAEARQLLVQVRRDGPQRWQLASTIQDLETDVSQADADVQDELAELLAALKDELPASVVAT